MKAIWENEVIAESDKTIEVEGNAYFPPEDVNHGYLLESDTHTTCPWKGKASYYTVKVNGSQLKDAAWYYPDPKEEASHIKDYIAFWKGVRVTE